MLTLSFVIILRWVDSRARALNEDLWAEFQKRKELLYQGNDFLARKQKIATVCSSYCAHHKEKSAQLPPSIAVDHGQTTT